MNRCCHSSKTVVATWHKWLPYWFMVQCNYLDEESFTTAAKRNAGGSVTFSSVKNYTMKEFNADTFSIKYVLQGTENYFISGRKFSVSANTFLLVNRQQPIDILVSSRKKVDGFCLHLRPHLLQQVYAQLLVDESILLSNPEVEHQLPLFENLLYKPTENTLGRYLQQLATQFNRTANAIDMEPPGLYYQLAHHLLQTQNRFTLSPGNLSTLKNSTREELLRRLALAKEIIEACTTDDLNVEALAQQCALSGAHLYRSFKKVYSVSPYQYFLQQKIKKAALLLQNKSGCITEVALGCGFADLSSFSRAFRKHYRQSPTAFIQNKTKVV